MTVPITNVGLKAGIQTEFGGTAAPVSLSSYYRGGANVPSGTADGGYGLIATSGQISIGTFRNTSKTVNVNLTISANTSNYNIFTAAGSPAVPANVTVTVNPGIFVYGTSTATPALSTGSGWAVGSTITLVNNGNIIGSGGIGGYTSSNGNVFALNAGAKGGNGGDALQALYAITVTNNGKIAGGGGGGGSGATVDPNAGSAQNYGGNGNGGTGVVFPSNGGVGSSSGTLSNILSNGSGSAGSSSAATYNGTDGTNGANATSTSTLPLGIQNTGSGGGGFVWASGGGAGGALGGRGGLGGPYYNYSYGYPSTAGGYPGNYALNDSNITWSVAGTRLGRVDNKFTATGHPVRLQTGFGLVAVTRTSPTTASVSITFNTNGTISMSGSGTASWSTTDNWYSPTTTSIGNNYWIRCTAATGSVTTGSGTPTATTSSTWAAPSPNAGTGTWLPLSSARTWGQSIAAVGKTVTQLTFDIASDSLGSNIVATAIYHLKVYRSA